MQPSGSGLTHPLKLRLPIFDVGYQTEQGIPAKRIADVDFDIVSLRGEPKIERSEIGGVTDPQKPHLPISLG